MSEQKRYTAQKMREVADMFNSATNPIAVCFCDNDGWHPNYIECHVEQMLRQAADAKEELLRALKNEKALELRVDFWRCKHNSLKARLDAVVKMLEEKESATSCSDCGRYNGYPCADHDECGLFKRHEEFTAILRAARGESENENK